MEWRFCGGFKSLTALRSTLNASKKRLDRPFFVPLAKTQRMRKAPSPTALFSFVRFCRASAPNATRSTRCREYAEGSNAPPSYIAGTDIDGVALTHPPFAPRGAIKAECPPSADIAPPGTRRGAFVKQKKGNNQMPYSRLNYRKRIQIETLLSKKVSISTITATPTARGKEVQMKTKTDSSADSFPKAPP